MSWIPCNLPWYRLPSTQKMPPEPVIPRDRIEAQFGVSSPALRYQLSVLRGAQENRFGGGPNPIESLPPNVQQELREGYAKLDQMEAWEKQQPEWVAYTGQCQRVLEALAEEERRTKEETFVGRGLNFPGVLIELENGKRILLGHFDANGRTSTSATDNQIQPTDIVKRYMVLDMPGLEMVSEEMEEQLLFRAANDLAEHLQDPRFQELADVERWAEQSGMEACVQKGFRPCDENPVAAAAAEKALETYLGAYRHRRDLTAGGVDRK